ncbi:MAG: 2-C-methyl-D-erythritol 4-phosphate cytidylyltransferase [Bacteroidales bacterium]
MNINVIVVAGGKGARMNTEVPKQFLLLRNKPILAHTIERFHLFCNTANIIVVLPKEQICTWQEYIRNRNFDIPHKFVAGGETRFHSVKNGLSKITSNTGIVMIHDGVRPLVDNATLKRCIDGAENYGAVVPARNITESLRLINDDNSTTAVDRSRYMSVQTPQTFKTSLITACYKQEYKENFTDDASVAEHAGVRVECVEGNIENIKITYPSDIKIADILYDSIS